MLDKPIQAPLSQLTHNTHNTLMGGVETQTVPNSNKSWHRHSQIVTIGGPGGQQMNGLDGRSERSHVDILCKKVQVDCQACLPFEKAGD